jgi:hypothetical protein
MHNFLLSRNIQYFGFCIKLKEISRMILLFGVIKFQRRSNYSIKHLVKLNGVCLKEKNRCPITTVPTCIAPVGFGLSQIIS